MGNTNKGCKSCMGCFMIYIIFSLFGVLYFYMTDTAIDEVEELSLDELVSSIKCSTSESIDRHKKMKENLISVLEDGGSNIYAELFDVISDKDNISNIRLGEKTCDSLHSFIEISMDITNKNQEVARVYITFVVQKRIFIKGQLAKTKMLYDVKIKNNIEMRVIDNFERAIGLVSLFYRDENIIESFNKVGYPLFKK